MPPFSCEARALIGTPQPKGALHRCRKSFSIKAEVILVTTQLPTLQELPPFRMQEEYTPLSSSMEGRMGYRFYVNHRPFYAGSASRCADLFEALVPFYAPL